MEHYWHVQYFNGSFLCANDQTLFWYIKVHIRRRQNIVQKYIITPPIVWYYGQMISVCNINIFTLISSYSIQSTETIVAKKPQNVTCFFIKTVDGISFHFFCCWVVNTAVYIFSYRQLDFSVFTYWITYVNCVLKLSIAAVKQWNVYCITVFVGNIKWITPKR